MATQAASPSQKSIAVALLPVAGSDSDEEPFQHCTVLSVLHGRRSGLRSGPMSTLGSGWWPCHMGRALEGRLKDWWQGGALWLDSHNEPRL